MVQEEVDDTIDHASQSGLKMQRRPQGTRNARQPEPGGPNGVVPPKSVCAHFCVVGWSESHTGMCWCRTSKLRS